MNADNGYLNIRHGPGPKYELVTTMPLGEKGLVGRCVPLDGGYLPFCEVEWGGVTGWASSCCISDMEHFPSPQQLQPQAPQAANELSLFCTNMSICRIPREWSDRASGQSSCRMELACYP